ncbi:MAG: hypothetical protein HPY84_07925 [Syntrophobacteraceae bacterium]|jgi:hypothetical protein|nr:hypothetical protein [Syntrophobacteraceae bacterium]
MTNLVLIGVLVGALCAYLVNMRKMNFRVKLIEEYESSRQEDGSLDYFCWIVRNGDKWIRSISIVKKPFSRHVNLAIETAALIYACVGLINAFSESSRYFKTYSESAAVIVFLGAVIAFIPCEWVLSGRIEKEIRRVLGEVKDALDRGRLDRYFAEARKTWIKS